MAIYIRLQFSTRPHELRSGVRAFRGKLRFDGWDRILQLFRTILQRASCGGVYFLDGGDLSAEHVYVGFEDVSVGGTVDTGDEGREFVEKVDDPAGWVVVLRVSLGGEGGKGESALCRYVEG